MNINSRQGKHISTKVGKFTAYGETNLYEVEFIGWAITASSGGIINFIWDLKSAHCYVGIPNLSFLENVILTNWMMSREASHGA